MNKTNHNLAMKWHQLDPGFGGYASVHIGIGHDLKVLTTPISLASRDTHFNLLKEKIAKNEASII